MTRAQRRIALRKRTAAAAGLPDTFTPAGHLGENPNSGKRHVARMCPTDGDVARMVTESRVPVPVSVREHRIGSRGRMSVRVTHSYVTDPSDFR